MGDYMVDVKIIERNNKVYELNNGVNKLEIVLNKNGDLIFRPGNNVDEFSFLLKTSDGPVFSYLDFIYRTLLNYKLSFHKSSNNDKRIILYSDIETNKVSSKMIISRTEDRNLLIEFEPSKHLDHKRNTYDVYLSSIDSKYEQIVIIFYSLLNKMDMYVNKLNNEDRYINSEFYDDSNNKITFFYDIKTHDSYVSYSVMRDNELKSVLTFSKKENFIISSDSFNDNGEDCYVISKNCPLYDPLKYLIGPLYNALVVDNDDNPFTLSDYVLMSDDENISIYFINNICDNKLHKDVVVYGVNDIDRGKMEPDVKRRFNEFFDLLEKKLNSENIKKDESESFTLKKYKQK